MALTSASLPALPKLDKNQFIDSYLRGQKAHAKSYAEEGRSLSSSWHIHTTPQKPAAVSSGSHNVGFATPILTARTPHPVNREASKKENIPSKSANKPTADKKPKANDVPDKVQKSKKRARPESDPDEDQVARLLERRERKRVKRAIVQPKEPSEPDTASSNGNFKSKKRTKAKGKKPKVPAGFALMHGFTATNVGKNRLTLKPPSNVGVFKKGKASFNAKIKAKPKGHKTQHFSEFGFLNNTKKVADHVASDSSSASSSESSATSAQEIQKPKKKAVSQKSRQVAVAKTASETHPTADSEIWDIESHASAKKKLRRQKTQSVEKTSAIQVAGTVVVDARMPAWSERVARAAEVDAGEIPDAIVIPSSPSLRPSQSASQVQPLVHPQRIEAASRYFPAVKQAPAIHSTPPPPPPVKPVPSPAEIDQDLLEPQLQPPPVHPVSSDLNVFVPPTHFAIPSRNRIFANQFLSVRQDTNLHLSTMIQAAPQDSEDRDQYASTLDCLETFELGFHPDKFAPQYSVDAEPPIYDDTQRGHYVSQSGGDWNDTPTPPDGWLDNCDEEDHHDKFSVPYENTFADPEYMDAIGEEDYLEPAYAESEPGPLYGQCEQPDVFMDIVDEFGSNAGWEAATADSVYLDNPGYEPNYGHDAVAFDEDGHQIMEDAFDDQQFIEPSVREYTECDGSECSDPTSAYNARFSQGRALLLGLPVHDSGERLSQPAPHFSSAEVDVVKALRGHWLPQRL